MENFVLPGPEQLRGSMAALSVTAVLLLILPILFVLVWKRRCGKAVSLVPLVFGAVGFLVTVRVLELGVHMVCIVLDNPVSRFINGHTWAYVLYGISMAGIFEECGRYVILRFLMKKHRGRENSVMYGIGHGGIEVWAITLVGVISMLAVDLTVSAQGVEGALSMMGLSGGATETMMNSAEAALAAATGFGPLTAGLTVFERVCAMLAHIGLTVIVAYGVESGKKRYLAGAVLAHAVFDIFPALYQRGVVSMAAVEIWAAVCVAALMAASVWLYRKFPRDRGDTREPLTAPR